MLLWWCWQFDMSLCTLFHWHLLPPSLPPYLLYFQYLRTGGQVAENVSSSAFRHTATCRHSLFQIYITFSFLIRDIIKTLKINAQLHKFEYTWRQVQRDCHQILFFSKNVFHNLSHFKKVEHCTGHTQLLHFNYGNSCRDVRNKTERKWKWNLNAA